MSTHAGDSCQATTSSAIVTPNAQVRKGKEKTPAADSSSHIHDSSDSEMELDYAELEKKRDFNLRRLVIADHHFSKLRGLLRTALIVELEAKREMALNRTGPDFLERKEEMDREFDHRKRIIQATHDLGKDQLMRKRAARSFLRQEVDMACDAKRFAKERLEEEILGKIRELGTSEALGEEARRNKNNSKKRTKTRSAAEARRRKNLAELRLGCRILVCQLDKEAIEEDVDFAENMIHSAQIQREIKEESEIQSEKCGIILNQRINGTLASS